MALPLDKMKELLLKLGLNVSLMSIGLFGSLVTVVAKEKINIKASIAGIISGTLIANYLTPLVLKLTSVGADMQNAIAFILGLTGLNGAKWAYSKLSKKYGL